jgi:segregation and condensation protein B
MQDHDDDDPQDERPETGPAPSEADGASAPVGPGAGAEAGADAATGGPSEDEQPVLPPLEIRAVLEALIFASPQPITVREIVKVLGGVPKPDWQAALEEIKADYAREGRGLQVVEVAGGWQITTRPEYNDWVRELLDPRQPTRLSIQALETLAVIAYKQPVTLPEIIDLRGVKSGGVLKTLLEKRLIKIVGRKEVVGRPILYGTSKQFLLQYGLKDLGELPRIEDFAEVLGEEVDVPGLKRALEAPAPAGVELDEDALAEAAQGSLPLGDGGESEAASGAASHQAHDAGAPALEAEAEPDGEDPDDDDEYEHDDEGYRDGGGDAGGGVEDQDDHDDHDGDEDDDDDEGTPGGG